MSFVPPKGPEWAIFPYPSFVKVDIARALYPFIFLPRHLYQRLKKDGENDPDAFAIIHRLIKYNESMPYVDNIEERSLANNNFRTVLFTDTNLQLVVMSLKPNEDIGEEVHQLDQFIRIEKGEGKAVLAGKEYPLKDGVALVIPKGTMHNIINTSATLTMKLYTLYAPPNHPPETIHQTKAEAVADEAYEHH